MKLPRSVITPDVKRLLALLDGRSGCEARLVGGCVRNALLGLPITDFDIATTHSPQDVISIMAKSGIKIVPTGIEHGTVTAVLNGVGYEITTLRRDELTNGRHAVVTHTTNWEEDAARRDFTINALYANKDGQIYDPTGFGLRDLERRKVIFVGNPELRVQEDYLRILRFFRFHSLYGKGAPDKKSLAACAKFASKLSSLSRERITQEFTKILMGTNPKSVLSLMQNEKIMPSILGKNFEPDRIGLMAKFQNFLTDAPYEVLLASRIFLLGKSFCQKCTKNDSLLLLNKNTISILNKISKIKIDTKRFNKEILLKNIYLFDRNYLLAGLLVAAVHENISAQNLKKILNFINDTKRPVYPISGADILALGIPQGKELGVTLSRLEKKWIKSDFSLTRSELLKGLQK